MTINSLSKRAMAAGVSLLGLGAAGSGSAAAQTVQDVLACLEIDREELRLACFDGTARSLDQAMRRIGIAPTAPIAPAAAPQAAYRQPAPQQQITQAAPPQPTVQAAPQAQQPMPADLLAQAAQLLAQAAVQSGAQSGVQSPAQPQYVAPPQNAARQPAAPQQYAAQPAPKQYAPQPAPQQYAAQPAQPQYARQPARQLAPEEEFGLTQRQIREATRPQQPQQAAQQPREGGLLRRLGIGGRESGEGEVMNNTGDVQALHMAIDRIQSLPRDRFRIYFDNGQVWETTESTSKLTLVADGRSRADRAKLATVRKGLIGGYLMTIEGVAYGLRVRRVE